VHRDNVCETIKKHFNSIEKNSRENERKNERKKERDNSKNKKVILSI